MSSTSFAAWRAVVSQKSQAYTRDGPPPGLLLDSSVASEQWFSGALRARARVPPQACGVSLAFLTHLAISFKELGLEGKMRSTTMVVAKFLGPAGLIQPFPSLHERSSSHPQLQQLTQLQELPGACSREEDMPNSASSCAEEVSPKRAAPQKPRSLKKGTSINSVSVNEVKEARTRVWDVIAPHWCGKPSYYVCHTWGMDFIEMLEALVDRLSQLKHKSHEAVECGEYDPAKVYVWLDFVALPQQFLGYSTTLEGPVYGPPPGVFDLLSVKETITSCERGVVLVLDRNMAILSRVWPLYEVWIAAYYCPQDISTSRVCVAIARNTKVDALLHLQTSCLGGLDLSRCSATKAEDKQHILREVRHAAGQKRMQMLTSESILRAARGWLRWSGDAQDLGMYAALMLQSKEYAQLQYVLDAVDEIHDDEATLKEIRALFEIYDEDGTGSLEEDEFTQVLAMAGFGLEESRMIFNQVDTDGGGSVDLEEFETWWIESQRQQKRACRPKPELTVSGLVKNLKGLSSLLQRKEKDADAATITELAEGLYASAVGPKSSFPDGTLPPTEIYGDWRVVANTLGFKITANDLRPALRLLHGLLMANVDLLMLDANPTSLLPSPSSLGTDIKLQRVVLAWFMALMAELLSRNPHTLKEANFFLREAIDLSAPERHDAQVYSTDGVIDATITKARVLKSSNKDAQMESLVEEMIRLKHGKDTIVSNRLVAEANISLSVWMASSKGKCLKVPTQGTKQGQKNPLSSRTLQLQSVANFTTSYLSDNNPEQVHPKSNEAAAYGEKANQRAASLRSLYEGKSHASLAYSLGVTSMAAIQQSKRGEPSKKLINGDSEESDIEDDHGCSLKQLEASLTVDNNQPEYQAEFFDRCQRDAEGSQRSPNATSAPPNRLWQSDGGVISAPLQPLIVTEVPPTLHQTSPMSHFKTPGKTGQQSPKVLPGPSSFAVPDAQSRAQTQGGSLSTPQHLLPGLEPQGRVLAHVSKSERLPRLNSIPGFLVDPDRPAPLALHISCSPKGMPLSSWKSSTSSLQEPPKQGPGSTQHMKLLAPLPHVAEGSKQDQLPEVQDCDLDAHCLLSWEPITYPDPISPTKAKVGKPFVLERSLTAPSGDTDSPPGTPSHTQQPSMPSPFMQVPDTNMNMNINKNMPAVSNQSRLLPSKSFPALASMEPMGGQAAKLPKLRAPNLASIGNSFAERVAAAREQPRIAPPMMQPKVTARDLEALRQRMSMQAGAQAVMEAGHTEAMLISTRFLSCTGTQDCPALPHVLTKRSSGMQGAGSDTGADDASPTAGKSSRLRKARFIIPTMSSELEGGGVRQLPRRASLLTAANPKCFSQLPATGLPSLPLTRPGDQGQSGLLTHM